MTSATSLITRDGSEISVEDSAAPIRDRDSRLLGAVLVFQDSTEKRQRQKALEALKDSLAADLSRMARLHEISTRLAGKDDLSSLLTAIVEASIEITGADMGSIQLLDEAGGLRIAAHNGLDRPFLDYFGSVSKEVHIVCGRAMADCRRVIVDDVIESPLLRDSPTLDVLLKAGIRAFQTTPLIGRTGEVVGMFSTHYQTARQPEEADLRLLDLLARQAADLIERMRVIEALNKRSAQLEAANKELESFSYSVSHDLRAPLRAIDGYSRMILRKHADKFDDDAMRQVQRHPGQHPDDGPAHRRPPCLLTHGQG